MGKVRYGVLCDMVSDIRLGGVVYGDRQNDASCNARPLYRFFKNL